MGWKDMVAKEPEVEKVPEEQEAPGEEGMKETEEGIKQDLDEALVGFMNRREKENSRFKELLDTNYYFVVCFTNNAQMVEFCDEFGLDIAYKYYDGREVAKSFRKALKTPDIQYPREKGKSKEYVDRALPVGWKSLR